MAAGGSLSWRGGSPPCVWTANDGPLQAGQKKKKVTACLSACASAAGQEAPHLQLQQQNEFNCLISLGKKKSSKMFKGHANEELKMFS